MNLPVVCSKCGYPPVTKGGVQFCPDHPGELLRVDLVRFQMLEADETDNQCRLSKLAGKDYGPSKWGRK